MRYIAFDSKTDKEITSSNDKEQLIDFMRNTLEYKDFDWYCSVKHSCRGCDQHKDDVQEYSDWYGITTGYWCEDCYENKYPYRKDRYPTEEYDGYGERLDDEY